MLGSQALPVMTWVPAMLFLASLIDYTTSSQEVKMVDSSQSRGFIFSISRTVGSVLTSLIGSALLI
jgi:hypothetical protein